MGLGANQPGKNATPLLSMSRISKSFAGQEVLHGVDFDLIAGEVHVLAGENGAGKSTLIKILAGVHAPDAGEIRLRGERITPRSPQEAKRQGISVIHQELSLVPMMSVVDNMYLGREHTTRLGWVRHRVQRRQAEQLLKSLGLQDIPPDQPIGALPLATQQLVEIAKALAFNARILVMDEPTSALSQPEVTRLFDRIAHLKQQGCGIIYITHKMDEIYALADRITILRDGHLIETTTAEALPRPKLIRQMVGRSFQEQFPTSTHSPGPACLEVKELSLQSENKQRNYLQHVSFTLRRGEILGLGGLSGSGASELLAALFGVYGKRPQGAMRLDGQPYAPRTPREALRAGVALLNKDRKSDGLVLNMGVRENTTLANIPAYSPYAWLQPKREALSTRKYQELLGIRMRDVEQPVMTLSGGNQQKVCLAKWLDINPKVLLLDEPTRGVDVGAKQEIYALMQKWAASGMAILLISTEMPELLAMSDRILVLHRGQVTATWDRQEATQDKILLAAMGGTDTT